jgi:hypothetical protein
VLLPCLARADCLSGVGSTGFQSGTWTLSVTLPNSATVSEIEGTLCEPNDGVIGPLTAGTGAGTSGYIADYGGTHAYVSVLSGGLQVGTGGASSGGTAAWTVRVESQPGYAGPSQIDIVLTAEVFVSGSAEVSGAGSAGGTYQSEILIRPAAGGPATILLVSNGALAGASHSYPTATATVNIDTSYVIQLFQSAVATAAGQPDPISGDIGSAAAGGAISQSFGIGIDPAYADPLLTVHFPIEDEPGGFAPFPGSAPILPTIGVPAVSASGLCVLALALTLCAWEFAAGRRGIGSSKP